ncbi:TPA: hypothetical protein G8N70_003080 [Salmonella enterica]|uniref:Type IV pilus biogenesis protein PilP n=1 Tax=Salmonella enterica TaxID=28901 RepID=A0A744HEA2_SALER|nr:hypothetical protein [Salmonella enterica]HAF4919935.1 hypothetical protein [Salmonella enterica]
MSNVTFSQSRRLPWFRLIAAVWLLALSIGLVIVFLDVMHPATPPVETPHPGQLEALSARLSQAEQQLAAIRHQATPVMPEALAMVRSELESRLTRIEASLSDDSTKQSLSALQNRMEKLESRPAPVKAAPSVSRPSHTVPKPVKVPGPPFQVMGVELRGGERFLTVLASGTDSLNQVRLLRAGESIGNWILESIGTGRATFRVQGKIRQVVVP